RRAEGRARSARIRAHRRCMSGDDSFLRSIRLLPSLTELWRVSRRKGRLPHVTFGYNAEHESLPRTNPATGSLVADRRDGSGRLGRHERMCAESRVGARRSADDDRGSPGARPFWKARTEVRGGEHLAQREPGGAQPGDPQLLRLLEEEIPEAGL